MRLSTAVCVIGFVLGFPSVCSAAPGFDRHEPPPTLVKTREAARPAGILPLDTLTISKLVLNFMPTKISLNLEGFVDMIMVSKSVLNDDMSHYGNFFDKAAEERLDRIRVARNEIKAELLQLHRRLCQRQTFIPKLAGSEHPGSEVNTTVNAPIPAAMDSDLFSDLIDTYNRKRGEVLERIGGIRREIFLNYMMFRRTFEMLGYKILKEEFGPVAGDIAVLKNSPAIDWQLQEYSTRMHEVFAVSGVRGIENYFTWIEPDLTEIRAVPLPEEIPDMEYLPFY